MIRIFLSWPVGLGLLIVWLTGMSLLWRADNAPPAPTKTETLTCVRVKQVTPAGTINYLCEVKNAKPQ